MTDTQFNIKKDWMTDSLPDPATLRTLSPDALTRLADVLRRRIIDQVAKNGGHLASNLGVVELTIALLYVFDFPNDKIVFDVGHQCYAWKLLTGRDDRFVSLRKKDGLSGFPKRTESPYDIFETGHSSTSVSAAAGLARAARLSERQQRTIALIGDGALSGGMAFEALNDIGHGEDDVLVILNDNQMSIGRGVGGLARHLEKVRLSPRYHKLKSVWEPRLDRLGFIGRGISCLLRRLKRIGRSMTSRGQENVFFEELGFRYYGPIDGHDLPALFGHLDHIKTIKGPVLLHVATTKGKGYDFAETEPTAYHGVAPFIIENGLSRHVSTRLTFSHVFGRTVSAMAAKDKTIVAISAAMTDGTGLRGFASRHKERFYDVGIAEQHAVTLAAGLAAGGMRPFVALYSTFLQRAVDQLIHDICLQNFPVVLAIDRAGAVGADGPTHQGYYDLAIANSLPNLTVFAPADGSDLECALYAARQLDGPALIRYPRSTIPTESIQRQHAYAVYNHGGNGNIAILSIGSIYEEAQLAVAMLRNEGVDCRHLSALCTKPFDFDGMMVETDSVDYLCIIEDGVAVGGVGESIANGMRIRHFKGEIVCMGHRQLMKGQASREQLLAQEGLDADGIVAAIRQLQTRQWGPI